ncbi:TonB family protein [Halioxenophilus sp. WMMB6]|uniref:TonB family protein n=1 Tax=Halioxenophilus sp. WMMB6 TaxID=3073815 RepID=UPI00295EA5B0|nr:TonB family protein [Halioxenophilus sp. WMMB6]
MRASSRGAALSHPVSLIIWVVALAVAPVLKASAEVNGLAVFKQFGKERYIAALHLPQLTDQAQEALLQRSGSKMEFAIIAESISQRSLVRSWLESITVNADDAALDLYASDISTLVDMIKGAVYAGDHLVFAKTTEAMVITLNGIELGRLSSPGLFDLMLDTWIGAVPPSSEFREGLLSSGTLAPELLARYQQVKPAAKRAVQIEAEWLPLAAEPESEVAEADAAADAEPEPTTVAATKPAAPAGSVKPDVKAPTVKPPVVRQSTGGAKAALVEAEALLSAVVSAETLRENRRYYNEVKKKIYHRVQYPDRALRLGRESIVGLNVRIDPDGKLMEVIVSEESEYQYFNKAAVRAVEVAEPFPAPPSAVLDEGAYELNLIVNFRLAEPS